MANLSEFLIDLLLIFYKKNERLKSVVFVVEKLVEKRIFESEDIQLVWLSHIKLIAL